MALLIEDTKFARGPKADDYKSEEKDREPQSNDDYKSEEKDREPQSNDNDTNDNDAKMECYACKRKSNGFCIRRCRECQKMTCIHCCGEHFENVIKFGGYWIKCTQMRCVQCVAKFEDMLDEYEEDYNEQELLDEYDEYVLEIHKKERFLDDNKKRTKWSYESNRFEFK